MTYGRLRYLNQVYELQQVEPGCIKLQSCDALMNCGRLVKLAKLGVVVVSCNLGGMVKGFVGWQELTTWKTHLANLLM